MRSPLPVRDQPRVADSRRGDPRQTIMTARPRFPPCADLLCAEPSPATTRGLPHKLTASPVDARSSGLGDLVPTSRGRRSSGPPGREHRRSRLDAAFRGAGPNPWRAGALLDDRVSLPCLERLAPLAGTLVAGLRSYCAGPPIARSDSQSPLSTPVRSRSWLRARATSPPTSPPRQLERACRSLLSRLLWVVGRGGVWLS